MRRAAPSLLLPVLFALEVLCSCGATIHDGRPLVGACLTDADCRAPFPYCFDGRCRRCWTDSQCEDVPGQYCALDFSCESLPAGEAVAEKTKPAQPDLPVAPPKPAGAREQPAAPGLADRGTPLPPVRFATASDRLEEESAEALRRFVRTLTPERCSLQVDGHADERGSEPFNLELSRRRAHAVREALVAAGFPAERIVERAFGESRPSCAGHDEACWALNRRADVTVMDAEGR